MNKKFKVRVRYYTEHRYQIDYCYYYFVPNWRTITWWCTFFNQWIGRVFYVKEAEVMATSFKSIEDIHRYYDNQKRFKNNDLKQKELTRKRNMPYKLKMIINET